MKIKPIETVWDGHRFRSRLEARWAVFFDYAGVKYDYEPEGFELPSGALYLPDFYLPEIRWWVEVKGDMTPEDESKINEFREYVDEHLLVVNELPILPPPGFSADSWWNESLGGGMKIAADNFDAGDWPYLFCVCPACGKIGIAFEGRGWRICDHDYWGIDLENHTFVDEDGRKKKMAYQLFAGYRADDKGYSSCATILRNAFLAARTARFERGDAPIPRRSLRAKVEKAAQKDITIEELYGYK